EAQARGRAAEAVDVAFEERDAVFPPHRLDERIAVGGRSGGEEPGLEQTLAVLGPGVGVPYDAAAGAHLARAAAQHDGADGDAEDGPAAGRRVADGAAVDAAGRRLQGADDLHRPYLWGSRDRAAREERAEEVRVRAARGER